MDNEDLPVRIIGPARKFDTEVATSDPFAALRMLGARPRFDGVDIDAVHARLARLRRGRRCETCGAVATNCCCDEIEDWGDDE